MSVTITDVPLDGRFTRDRLRAVLAEICGVAGLDPRGARLVRFTSNAVFRLAHQPVVVRIVGSPAMHHRARKIVLLAEWLAEQGVPAARLAPGVPQPMRIDGYVATLWKLVPQGGPPPTGKDLALLLRRLHDLPRPPFELPRWAPLDDVRRRVADAEELAAADRRFLLERCAKVQAKLERLCFRLPAGVVHGDAHLGNLIPTRGGPVWCDFDSTCFGPPEWDLTTLPVGVQRFGHPELWHRQLVDGYGFDVTRWPGFAALREARELKLTTSVLPILRSNPDVRVELRRRLAAFRSGDTSERWAPYR
jgi:aminoglycoside phosphotransferase (APT) family kinase protein